MTRQGSDDEHQEQEMARRLWSLAEEVLTRAEFLALIGFAYARPQRTGGAQSTVSGRLRAAIQKLRKASENDAEIQRLMEILGWRS